MSLAVAEGGHQPCKVENVTLGKYLSRIKKDDVEVVQVSTTQHFYVMYMYIVSAYIMFRLL